MSVFLTDTERKAIKSQWDQPVIGDLFWQAIHRAMEDASQLGLRGPKTTLEYWHMAFETLSNASMIHALKPNDNLATWIRSATLELARRSDDEWIGPWFRNHTRVPSQGNLETAHLSWACASALDLAPEVFSSEEREEITAKLINTGLPLCREFLETTNKINNWNSILMAGIAVTAAVLDERENMDYAAGWFERVLDLFQNDGSYAESLQYSHYAQQGLFLTYEALVRRDPAYAEKLSPDRYGLGVRWTAASYLYHKPLEGWGPYPRPRSINFNDSAAMFRPQADLLLHINVRCSDSQPDMAGVARWLFDEYYTGERAQEPNDRASFGFYNNAGFLTLPLLSQAGAALAPKEACIKPLECFSNGDAIMRDAIDGATIVAVYGGADDLRVRAHRHGALNSGIVVHNRERILVDPGHSCYRGLLHGVETQTQTHNTLTFLVDDTSTELRPEDRQQVQILQQNTQHMSRSSDPGQSGQLLGRDARRLVAASQDAVRIVGHDAAQSYGKPIQEASRFWILCGSHALFVIDRWRSELPVKSRYHWLLNNRDDLLELKPVPPDRLVARRGQCGMKLFHLGGGHFAGPAYSYVHDCYHPLPAQQGESRSGSGLLIHWTDVNLARERSTIHAIALDSFGVSAGWHLFDHGPDGGRLEYGKENWECRIDQKTICINNLAEKKKYRLSENGDTWDFYQT